MTATSDAISEVLLAMSCTHSLSGFWLFADFAEDVGIAGPSERCRCAARRLEGA